MSNLRSDLLTGNKVIITENRAARPFDIESVKKDLTQCPFCRGNEEKTPPHLFTNGLPWNIRVVPNKYPAINHELNEIDETVTGSHYVIIDSDKHYNYIHRMELEELEALLYSYALIIDTLYEEETVKYVQLFKNYKKQGGSSLEHTHSQVISLSFIPSNIQKILNNSNSYYKKKKSCIFCDEIQNEKKNNHRVIKETNYFFAYAPYVSMFPYEFSIFPKNHSSNFSQMSPAEFVDLAIIMRELFGRLHINLNNPAYNYYINSINHQSDSFHWSIRVVPRTNIQAGFELSTGILLNPISPEKTKYILTK